MEKALREIMELGWTEELDEPFLEARLEQAAWKLSELAAIPITEARGRLWGRGDFMPRLCIIEALLVPDSWGRDGSLSGVRG